MQKEISKVIYRNAKLADIPQMLRIINGHASRGLMLEKNKSDLLPLIPNFLVAELNGKIIGTCGYKIWLTADIEIISSAILEKYHGCGFGSKLNKKIIDQARSIGFNRFFILTGRSDFYKKLNFYEIQKEELSFKLYADCIKCKRNINKDPNFPLDVDCPEVAMRLKFP